MIAITGDTKPNRGRNLYTELRFAAWACWSYIQGTWMKSERADWHLGVRRRNLYGSCRRGGLILRDALTVAKYEFLFYISNEPPHSFFIYFSHRRLENP